MYKIDNHKHTHTLPEVSFPEIEWACLTSRTSTKYQLVSLYKSSSHDAQFSQLDLFSFYDSFDESRTVNLLCQIT